MKNSFVSILLLLFNTIASAQAIGLAGDRYAIGPTAFRDGCTGNCGTLVQPRTSQVTGISRNNIYVRGVTFSNGGCYASEWVRAAVDARPDLDYIYISYGTYCKAQHFSGTRIANLIKSDAQYALNRGVTPIVSSIPAHHYYDLSDVPAAMRAMANSLNIPYIDMYALTLSLAGRERPSNALFTAIGTHIGNKVNQLRNGGNPNPPPTNPNAASIVPILQLLLLDE